MRIKFFTYLLFTGLLAVALPAAAQQIDTLSAPAIALDSLSPEEVAPDSPIAAFDTLAALPDSLPRMEVVPDTILPVRNFLEDIISGNNQDSLVYEPGSKMVYIYEKGDVRYQNMELKADYMEVDLSTKNVYAHGRPDSVDVETGLPQFTRPEFLEGGTSYVMDTIAYNLDSKKAKVKGLTTQEGEGFLRGEAVKMMPDNTINIQNGRYTTCDLEHPHFYIAMTRAKAIPGKKIIMGPSYMVFEDVPLPFLGIPMGFFPMVSERSSGFIVPEYGEEYVKGFFIRNGGYYFAFNDYVDATVTGGIYTLGSWEGALTSRYVKKYKFSGSLSARYAKNIIGDRGSADYLNSSDFQLTWTHTQDAKFRPNSTFAASVNFSTSGYNKYSATSMNDYLSTQTNSSISYSKRFAGTPISMSTNIQHSQNSRDTTISLSLPNLVVNVSKFYPFRWGPQVGKQKWYQKIGMSYTGTLANNVTVHERDLFGPVMYRNMKNGVNHVIPASVNFNILKYINFSPSVNYQERWYFKKIEKEWDPAARRVVISDTIPGFHRVYNYSASASLSTKIYGMFEFGKNSPVQAIRHTITPSISGSYTPDFSQAKYGYYKQVQSDTAGNMSTYSPYEGAMYGVPGAGRSAAISFSLVQTLEAKVRSRRDTTGIKKIAIIENLSVNGSYNFLADSMKLSTLSLNIRTAELFKGFSLNLSAQLDPYEVLNVDGRPVRIDRLTWRRGNLGRIVSTGWSFNYTLNSTDMPFGAMNDISNGGNPNPLPGASDAFFNDPNNPIDPAVRRQQMTSQYYDFSIPWNIGFNYSLSYANDGIRKQITQTLGFNGSVNLTEKWGITFSGGYDFQQKKLTPGTINLTRDLHCWQMNFQWVPVGFRSSWSFNIGVKSSMLKDLKYDKRSSFYDNLYK